MELGAIVTMAEISPAAILIALGLCVIASFVVAGPLRAFTRERRQRNQKPPTRRKS